MNEKWKVNLYSEETILLQDHNMYNNYITKKLNKIRMKRSRANATHKLKKNENVHEKK